MRLDIPPIQQIGEHNPESVDVVLVASKFASVAEISGLPFTNSDGKLIEHHNSVISEILFLARSIYSSIELADDSSQLLVAS